MRSGVGAFNYRRRFVHDDEFFIRWNNQHFDFGTIGRDETFAFDELVPHAVAYRLAQMLSGQVSNLKLTAPDTRSEHCELSRQSHGHGRSLVDHAPRDRGDRPLVPSR
jgi:hypothetical protein